ncbi:hypothetical protein F5Y00DRAFT_271473 [Daldinia vernicosa]|uniref:uncharacterized protein n=1 Tax=Daldinia vernicosa TaxID=114800 RepID=UPI0020088DBB|nr:uncharacterized protein F5Y00DRAFT_271473 [Daldinia vernicosa]KAI0847005.1 hypothetical protein F5Y00DRAFT_271473 [Daldinia vernicosa]
MAPLLQFDVMARVAQHMELWECLRMGRMNKRLNSAVFNHAVRYVFENPHRYRALQPVEYAFVTGNLGLLTTLRDIIVTSNVRVPEGWSYTVDFGSVVREFLYFESMLQCLRNPEGPRCFELIIDTAISTGTVPSLDIWGINSPSMLLGNSIKYNRVDAVQIILRRRSELGLGNFLEEMCYSHINVIDGFVSQYHLTEEMVRCLIVGTDMSFHDACRLTFIDAIDYILRNTPELAHNPQEVLYGFDHLIQSPSWFRNPHEGARSIARCITLLNRYYRTRSPTAVPIQVVDNLLNRAWRVLNPIIRYELGVGASNTATQDQLLDTMAASPSCQQYHRLLDVIIDLHPMLSNIPKRNANHTVRLGHVRFVDLVRRDNVGLPLIFSWNSHDRSIFNRDQE